MKSHKGLFYGGGTIAAVLVIGIVVLFIGVWLLEDKDTYSLALLDESDKEEAEDDVVQAESGSELVSWNLENTSIRVLLYNSDYQSMYHEELRLTGNTDEIVLNEEVLRNSFDTVCVRCAESGYSLEQIYDGYRLENTNTGRITQCSITRSMGTPAYRGSFYIYPEEEGLVIVNELPFEEYLYGVLPSEMPASYENEALKAQAVCARTFACRYLEEPKYPQYDVALDDSTSCQVYMNLPEQAETSFAVDETRGILLTYNGALATTFYYSTSCGLSADVTTWPDYRKEDYPYLSAYTLDKEHRAVDFSDDMEGERLRVYLNGEQDAYERELPWYRWACTIECADTQLMYTRMAERYLVKPEMVQKYRDGMYVDEEPEPFGILTDISVQARNSGGSVAALYLEGTECSYLIYGEYNIRYILCGTQTQVTKQDGTVQTMTTILPSGFFVLEPILYNEGNIGYAMIGGGYGHGVGLSQNGANEMAKQGMNYQEILAYFYVGTQLMRIGGCV